MIRGPNIIFFGTPEFAEIILEKLIDSKYKPSLVVTAPDKPVGRKQVLTPPPVKVLAQKHTIPFLQPASLATPEVASELQKINPDLLVVAAYGKIIPKNILDIPKHGTLNVHPSLLPTYRGASPIQTALLNGDTQSGLTIMLMDEKMDHGPILAQCELNIQKEETSFTLFDKMAHAGAELLIQTIGGWMDGKITPREQNHKEATVTKIIKREDGHIDWNKSAEEIERMARAFTPWPGIFTFWQDKRLKILSLHPLTTSEVASGEKKENAGRVIAHEGVFAIQTKKGLLVPHLVQLEGKNPQSTKEFLKTHHDIIGSQLK